MARTIADIETSITNNETIKVLEYLKDYLTKMINLNTDKLNSVLTDVYAHVNGIDVVVGHIGKPLSPSATAPSNPNEYDWYFNTTSKEFKMYHNSAWITIATLTATVDLTNYYTKTEVDTELNKKADKSNTYTITQIEEKFEPKSTDFNPSSSHQTGFIILDETGIKDLPVGSYINLDISNSISTLITNPGNVPVANDQLFIGSSGAVRIPNSVGTAALKWETKTNPTDVNVKDNYATKIFQVKKISNTEYDFVKLVDNRIANLDARLKKLEQIK